MNCKQGIEIAGPAQPVRLPEFHFAASSPNPATLDCYDALVANAVAGDFPRNGDIFRYEFHRQFFVSPAPASLMLRCCIAGGADFDRSGVIVLAGAHLYIANRGNRAGWLRIRKPGPGPNSPVDPTEAYPVVRVTTRRSIRMPAPAHRRPLEGALIWSAAIT